MSDAWYGDEIFEAIETEIGRRVEEAGESLAEKVRQNVGVQGTPKNRSKPGEFPRRQTGELQSTIQSVFYGNDLQAFVGSDCFYAGFLIHGTSKMEPREFLMRSLNEEGEAIATTILGPDFTAAT